MKLKPPPEPLDKLYWSGARDMFRVVCERLSDYRDADEDLALRLKQIEEELK